MKPAKVVEVRDVRASINLDPAYTDPERRSRAEELLRAYPETNEEETAEIVQFLARGMHLDVGLVTRQDEFKEKIASIRRDHRQAFRLGPLEVIIFYLVVLTPLSILVLLPHIMGRS